jgi:hypothetical protein
MCDSCPVHADVVVVTEFQEFLAGELGAIVGDDEVWYPNLSMMSVKNNTTYSDLRLVMGRASIHFDNLSIVTNNVKPPGAFRTGPTRSVPTQRTTT